MTYDILSGMARLPYLTADPAAVTSLCVDQMLGGNS